jgi:membrane dipeptidase
MIADAHNDLLMLVARRPPDAWARYFRTNWLPQLRAGGVGLQVLPVFIDDEFRPEGALRQTLRMIEAAHRIAADCPDEVTLCRTCADVRAAVDAGRIALVLALEGCPQIDRDVELIETFARLGVQVISLAHFGRSALADGSAEDAAGSRLTRAGVAALALMESLGVLLDVSHLGRAGVAHTLELARRPILASHSCARALHDHHRNLDDEQVSAIAAGGGMVCVNFVGPYLGAGVITLDTVVDHLEHLASVAGIDAVGLGADFEQEIIAEKVPLCDQPVRIDGVELAWAPGLDTPAGYPLLANRLVDRGWPADAVGKVLGGNLVRFLVDQLPTTAR